MRRIDPQYHHKNRRLPIDRSRADSAAIGRARALAVAIGLLAALPGCERQSGPGYQIHDTKYAAVGFNGEELDPAAEAWPCVLDRYTGLTWEAKSSNPGLHDWRNTYRWYHPGESHDRGLDYRGTPDGGACVGSACDTWALVNAVNAAGRCGHDDWRLPSRDELASISDPRRIEAPPTINIRFFPLAQPDEYWSANDYHFQYDAAWAWNFRFGHDRVDFKAVPKRVRLVRGEATELASVND